MRKKIEICRRKIGRRKEKIDKIPLKGKNMAKEMSDLKDKYVRMIRELK